MARKPSNRPEGFPAKVRLMHRWWKIEYVDQVDETGVEDLAGMCDSEQGVIRISARMCREMQARTLIHEMGHAVYRSMPGLPDDEEGEENVVIFFESAFFEMVRSVKNFWG